MKYLVEASVDLRELLAERRANTKTAARAIAAEMRSLYADRKNVAIVLSNADGVTLETWGNDSGEWDHEVCP